MKKLTLMLVAVFSLVLISGASAALNSYLSLTGETQGNSKNDGWIDILSVEWMAPESLSNQRAKHAAVRLASGDVSVTKYVDKSSPKLQEACTAGTEFSEITLAEGGVTYVLSKVTVASVKPKGKQEVVNLRYASRKPLATTRAAGNHNTTRSNKTQPAQDTASAQDYNSSRSNNTSRAASAAPAQDYNSSRSNN